MTDGRQQQSGCLSRGQDVPLQTAALIMSKSVLEDVLPTILAGMKDL